MYDFEGLLEDVKGKTFIQDSSLTKKYGKVLLLLFKSITLLVYAFPLDGAVHLSQLIARPC